MKESIVVDDVSEEIVDGDEGINNRRLPMNSFNNQVLFENVRRRNEDEDGWENCKEEDEERKEGDIMGESIRRRMHKGKLIESN